MFSAAPALPTVIDQPDDTLLAIAERLAVDDCALPREAASLGALCELVAQAVRETVLPRRYELTCEEGHSLYFAAANRRLVGMSPSVGGTVDAFPPAPSSEVADMALARLREAVDLAPSWRLRLSQTGHDVAGYGASCSGDALLRAAGPGGGDVKRAEARNSATLASLSITPATGARTASGEPSLLAAMETLSAAFLRSVPQTGAAARSSTEKACVMPLSADHAALISEDGGSFLFEAIRADDLAVAMQSWLESAQTGG